MTITDPNGTVRQATVLAHGENEIRAVTADSDDVLVLRRVHGTWISEDLEPVVLQFEWQRGGAPHVPSEGDCVCPKELAAHLIQTLHSGSEGRESAVEDVYVFSREGVRVKIDPSEFGLG